MPGFETGARIVSAAAHELGAAGATVEGNLLRGWERLDALTGLGVKPQDVIRVSTGADGTLTISPSIPEASIRFEMPKFFRAPQGNSATDFLRDGIADRIVRSPNGIVEYSNLRSGVFGDPKTSYLESGASRTVNFSHRYNSATYWSTDFDPDRGVYRSLSGQRYWNAAERFDSPHRIEISLNPDSMSRQFPKADKQYFSDKGVLPDRQTLFFSNPARVHVGRGLREGVSQLDLTHDAIYVNGVKITPNPDWVGTQGSVGRVPAVIRD